MTTTSLPVPEPVPAAAVAREHVRPPVWFAGAALGVGAGAAMMAVGSRPGLGLVLEIALASAVLLAAVRRSLSVYEWVLVALGAPLAVLPAVYDAEWLVALDVLAVMVLGCLVLAGGTTWTSIVGAGLSVAARACTAPMFLLRGLAPAYAGRAGPLVRGSVTAAALLLVFGMLFASADTVFADLASAVLPDVGALPERAVVFVVATCLAGGALAAHLAPVPLESPARCVRTRPRLEWVLPLGALVALFAAFVVVQFAVLFAGHDYVMRTAGLTYAEYARSGFSQLLVAAALVLAVGALCVRRVTPADAGELRLLRAALGALGVLTLVVLASAVRRLALYTDAFGLTHARVLAAVVAAWLGLVLVMCLGALARWSAGWLPRGTVVLTAVVLLGLNAAAPEVRIARSQVERFERTGQIDAYYVAGLGAEAVPAVMSLPAPVRDCVLRQMHERLRDGDTWTGANVARARARRLLRSAPADDGVRGQCDAYVDPYAARPFPAVSGHTFQWPRHGTVPAGVVVATGSSRLR